MTKQPNILIFMTDQQRWDTAPPFQRAITPNLDKFAAESVMFTETYTPSPHCCPSRATFFTGLYPSEHGVWNNVGVGNALSTGPYDGVRMWSEDLADHGYHLIFSGKWHVSAEESPADRGWTLAGATSLSAKPRPKGERRKPHTGDWNSYPAVGKLMGSPAPARSEGQILRRGYKPYTLYGLDENPFQDRQVIDNAIRAIRERNESEAPWCHYVGPLGPHDPMFVPQRFLDLYRDADIELPDTFHDAMLDKPNLYRRTRDVFAQLTEREHIGAIRHYLAFCSYEDDLFGEIMRELEAKNELDNTMVIYVSDHGEYCADHGLWTKGLPCFSSAYHVPLLIRWPGAQSDVVGKTCDAFVSLADIGPTLLDVAGIDVSRGFSGKSLMPFLQGREPNTWRDALFTQTNGNELYGIQRSVMTREWKYVYNGFDYDELYDLRGDPGEMRNLAHDPAHRETIERLSRKLWGFAYEHRDVCVNGYIFTGLASCGPGIVFAEAGNEG